MRQGNPAWAGYPNNHDGFNTMRASQMFMDQGTGQFWNDLGDGALNDVPQADIQLRLFSNAVVLSNAAKRPLPRLWYFPNQNRALLLMTGDHHGDSATNSVNEINTVQSFGGKFTDFLWYPFGSISDAQVNTWLAAGHAIHVHFDDTAEVDASGVGGSAATWSGMQNVIDTALASFAADYPTAPFPTTTRNHFLIWVSRNAAGDPDQTAQAKLFQNAGIELDVTYTAFPNRWGYMTGSGLPMKFLDTARVLSFRSTSKPPSTKTTSSWVATGTAWTGIATAQSHYQKSLLRQSDQVQHRHHHAVPPRTLGELLELCADGTAIRAVELDSDVQHRGVAAVLEGARGHDAVEPIVRLRHALLHGQWFGDGVDASCSARLRRQDGVDICRGRGSADIRGGVVSGRDVCRCGTRGRESRHIGSLLDYGQDHGADLAERSGRRHHHPGARRIDHAERVGGR